MVNLGFGFGSARTAVESRLWSSQGWNFPRCTTTENGRAAASLSPLGMWLPLLTSQSKGENGGGKEPRRRKRRDTQSPHSSNLGLTKWGKIRLCFCFIEDSFVISFTTSAQANGQIFET